MPDLNALTVTITDVRLAGNCVAGARRWFEGHGLDFSEFIKSGLPAQVLLDTEDGLANSVVAAKLAREYPDG